jgi:hypothetical protein
MTIRKTPPPPNPPGIIPSKPLQISSAKQGLSVFLVRLLDGRTKFFMVHLLVFLKVYLLVSRPTSQLHVHGALVSLH